MTVVSFNFQCPAYPTNADLETYAKSQDIPVEQARKLNVRSTVIGGSVVLVGGKKWGVLVVDSLKDWQSSSKGERTKQLKKLKAHVSLVERMIAEASQ